MCEWACVCCGGWRVSIELISGRYLYRLSRRYRREVGGVDVLGEVGTVEALDRLLRSCTPLTLADFREAG